MAKYTITKSCGHTETVELFGATAERERKIKWLESQPCRECEKQNNAAEAKASGLPELVGSEKQVSWAIDLRAAKLPKLQAEIDKVQATIKRYKEDANDAEKLNATAAHNKMTVEEVMQRINEIVANCNEKIEGIRAHMNETSAKWWIENR